MPVRKHSSLLKFWTPRYWLTWVVYLWMRVSVLLPIRWQVAIGRRAGKALSLLIPDKRRITERNIEVCFPELSPDERQTLCRKHYESMGAAFPEMAMGWFGSEKIVRDIVHIEGEEYLREALAKGKGVLLFCGHFTPLEILHPALKPICGKLSGMYRPMRNEMMNEIMSRGRGRSMDRLFSKYRVRELLKSLSDNSVVYYLMDQSHTGKHGALVPFFGEPAMTNTATTRILKASGATLLILFYRRCEDDSSYLAQIRPPMKAFPSDDSIHDAAQLMKELENDIRTCPDQYAWMHKRFKGRPDTLPDVYARPEPAGI